MVKSTFLKLKPEIKGNKWLKQSIIRNKFKDEGEGFQEVAGNAPPKGLWQATRNEGSHQLATAVEKINSLSKQDQFQDEGWKMIIFFLNNLDYLISYPK